jgi:hypothetical protein
VANRSSRHVAEVILAAFRSHPDRWMTSSGGRRLTRLSIGQLRGLESWLASLAEAGHLERRSTGQLAGGYPTFEYRYSKNTLLPASRFSSRSLFSLAWLTAVRSKHVGPSSSAHRPCVVEARTGRGSSQVTVPVRRSSW